MKGIYKIGTILLLFVCLFSFTSKDAMAVTLNASLMDYYDIETFGMTNRFSARETYNIDKKQSLDSYIYLPSTVIVGANYTIKYDANGGSGAPNSQVKYRGTDLKLSSTVPTRLGYKFLGWSESRTATVATYGAGDSYTEDYDITLYAVWESEKYIVSYDANGGSDAPSFQTKYYGMDLILSRIVPVQSGYEFLGWSTDKTATTATYSAGDIYTRNSDVTLYAVWKELEEYTITYDANGGEDTLLAQTKTEGVDLTITNVVPTRLGYEFLGWSASKTATVAAYSSEDKYTIDADLRLYAVWKREKYTITYDANGGSGAPFSQTKEYDIDLNLSSTMPTRWGYEFLGWSTNSTATTAMYNSGDGFAENYNVTLYAVWKKTEYTITYDANGGDGAPFSQTKIYGIDLMISGIEPTRNGYDFLGWSENSTATIATYSAGDDYTIDNNVTLYAVWKINEYTVTYNTNGGSGGLSSQTKIYGKDLIISSIEPIRWDYDFLGWSESRTATTATYASGEIYAENRDITLYAVWKKSKKEATITAKTNITKSYGTKKFNIGATIESDGEVSFKSSNNKIVKVSKKGDVTIKGYGKAKITITVAGTSTYKMAKKVITIQIIPDKVKGFKVSSPFEKKIVCSWSGSSSIEKCQIQVTTKKKFNAPNNFYSKATKKRFQLGKAKSSEKYYVRIRLYVTVGGKKIYGKWSTVKEVVVK